MKRVLVILTFVFILIRLPFLDQLFLLHDERDIVLSGLSIAKTGKDLFGNLLPLNFTGISPNNPVGAIYFSAISSLIFPDHSVFFARLPYVLISALLIWLMYELVLIISNNQKKALLTSVIFCFSPWVFHLTRLALDIPLAIVLLLAGMVTYLKNKRWIAYLLFFLTFYTYQGFRLLIPFLILYLEFGIPVKKITLTRLILDGVFIVLLLLSTIIIDPQTTKGRFNEIVFFNPDTVKEVIFRRNTSLASALLKTVLDNKITVGLDYMMTNLIKGQDLIYLFKEGDYSAINGNVASGQFFFVLIAFYYLGIASFGRRIMREDVYLIGLILVGMIPALLSTHGASFSIRAMPSGIGFAYIISLGLIFGWKIINKLKQKKLFLSAILIVLIINLCYVGYVYFLRRPVTVGEIFNENERTLSNALLTNEPGPHLIYHNMPQDGYLSLAFLDKDINIANVQKNVATKTYALKNYRFLPCNGNIKYKTLKHAIISERCLDVKTYEYFANINNPQVVKRIPYKDYSLKTAYFITR